MRGATAKGGGFPLQVAFGVEAQAVRAPGDVLLKDIANLCGQGGAFNHQRVIEPVIEKEIFTGD